MDTIEQLYALLDWNSTPEEWEQGFALARHMTDLSVFLQPCTERFHKNVWDGCAAVLAARSDGELVPYLERMLEWLQDLTWPGATVILERLNGFSDRAALRQAMEVCLQRAEEAGDEMWLEWLQEVQL